MVPPLRPSNGSIFSPTLKQWAEAVLLSTARVERAPSERARSAIFPLRSQGHGLNGSPTAPVEHPFLPLLYKNGVEGVVTQLRPFTSHILMWGVREQEGHPLYPMTALP